ncbi:MAG: NAD(P)/FAD-dependent oxidoreductase, partial [Planctomycetota bacterium]|nr:NAD(P)/FAD-dependent oxidoreductase [Planctomycetota bacterium]
MEQDRSDRLVAKGRVWYCRPGSNSDDSTGFHNTGQTLGEPYDVAIIGAGVVGCALAYRLSQYQVRVLLIDRHFDVGEDTSKANSAIIHTGFDATPDSLESRLVTGASRLWPQLAEKLKIPFDPISALLVALDQEQADQLGALHKKALANGVDDVEVVDAAKARQIEPNAGSDVRGGLLVPRESIVDPFTVSIAFAEVAVANGVDILLGSTVVGIKDAERTVKTIVDNAGRRINAGIIVNVAGLGSRAITQSHGGELFDINPRRGQFLIFDKSHRGLVNRILLPVPTATTKGKLVTPTIFGNLLAGPTAEDLPPGDDTATFTT